MVSNTARAFQSNVPVAPIAPRIICWSSAPLNLRLPFKDDCCRSINGTGCDESTIQGGVLAEPIVKDRSRLVENEKLIRIKRILIETEISTPIDNSTMIGL